MTSITQHEQRRLQSLIYYAWMAVGFPIGVFLHECGHWAAATAFVLEDHFSGRDCGMDSYNRSLGFGRVRVSACGCALRRDLCWYRPILADEIYANAAPAIFFGTVGRHASYRVLDAMGYFTCFRDDKLIGRSCHVFPARTEQVGDSDWYSADWHWHSKFCCLCAHSQPNSVTVDGWRFWRILWFRALGQYGWALFVQQMTAN